MGEDLKSSDPQLQEDNLGTGEESPVVDDILSLGGDLTPEDFYPALDKIGYDREVAPNLIEGVKRANSLLEKAVDITVDQGLVPDFTSSDYWKQFILVLSEIIGYDGSSEFSSALVKSLHLDDQRVSHIIDGEIGYKMGRLHIDHVVAKSGMLDEKSCQLYRGSWYRSAYLCYKDGLHNKGAEYQRALSQLIALKDEIGEGQLEKLRLLCRLALHSFRGFVSGGHHRLFGAEELFEMCEDEECSLEDSSLFLQRRIIDCLWSDPGGVIEEDKVRFSSSMLPPFDIEDQRAWLNSLIIYRIYSEVCHTRELFRALVHPPSR